MGLFSFLLPKKARTFAAIGRIIKVLDDQVEGLKKLNISSDKL